MHREIMQKTDSIKELEEQIEVMTEEMAKVRARMKVHFLPFNFSIWMWHAVKKDVTIVTRFAESDQQINLQTNWRNPWI